MHRPKTYQYVFTCFYEDIKIRRGDNIGRKVEQFVFVNLIELGLKLEEQSKNEFFHIYLPNTAEKSLDTIGIQLKRTSL